MINYLNINGEVLDSLAIEVKHNSYLNEIRKNLAANPERSPLIHSFGYGSAGDRPALFARFPLSFAPSAHYAG